MSPVQRDVALALLAAIVAGCAPSPPPASAHPVPEPRATRITVVAGAHYAAGWLHRWFLGRHHRDLWVTPLAIDVIDLSTFAGGLTLRGRGGGMQTKSLRFRGADGREYVFRSVDKDPSSSLPRPLRETFVAGVLQDQISSAHPAGALVVAPLLESVGVLHASPRLAVLPGDPRLGEFREEFAGVLGIVEERPEEGSAGEPGFAGAADVIGTDALLRRLGDSPEDRVDSREFLAARLLDIYVGDWDRHEDQWRWALFPQRGRSLWRPVPRDRDQAFVRLDGVVLRLARFYLPQVVSFGPEYPSIFGLTLAGQGLDRTLLVDLEKPVWDSIAGALHGKLTDSVIEGAVRELPPEFRSASGAPLAQALRRRRDDLDEAADRFYALLTRDVDVHATDRAERAVLNRLGDERLELTIYRRSDGGGDAPGSPYYRRRFNGHETSEIRVYLHGGDDQVIMKGNAKQRILVRVVGGRGDEEFIDSSGVGWQRTAFYDAEGKVRFTGTHAEVDRREFSTPPPSGLARTRHRDWGHWWRPAPWITVSPDLGLFVGGGPVLYGYGFRQVPYRYRGSLRVGMATAPRRFRAESDLELPELQPWLTGSLRLRASGIEILYFHGLGNDTKLLGSSAFYKLRQSQLIAAPSVGVGSGAFQLSIGPLVKYSHTSLDQVSFLTQEIAAGRFSAYGTGKFGQVGGQAAVRLDRRNRSVAASRGFLLTGVGAFYPRAWHVRNAFGGVSGEAAAYVSAKLPAEPTLALRAGGKKVWGEFPFHEAAYLGGAATVRGFSEQRFAGDAMVYGNAELRLFLTDFEFVLPGELGVFFLGDGGRAFVEGEASEAWHGAVGGGIWFSFIDRMNTVSVSLARSRERLGLYARAGFAY